MELSQNLKIAIEASVKAGKKILEIYNSDDFIVEYKLDESPLTLADRSSDEIIKNILLAVLCTTSKATFADSLTRVSAF